MPFERKNGRVTYQHLVNRIFDQIGKTMKVNIDDMITKSVPVTDHTENLREIFKLL